MGFSDAFPLDRYPLDQQNLQVRVENTTYDNEQLAYVVDHHVSDGNDLVVPGWKTEDIKYQEYMHHYGTDFGYTDRVHRKQDEEDLFVQADRRLAYVIGVCFIIGCGLFIAF